REAVAESLGVHRHTVSRWLTKYQAGGISEMLEIRTRPNRKRVMPADVYKKMEAELRRAPEQFSSYRDVQAWLRKEFDLDVKYKTLYRLVRYELKIDIAKAASGALPQQDVSETSESSTPKFATSAPAKPYVTAEERRPPTVANFFRSVASLLEDEELESADVIQAVRAASAILNASPPFGFFSGVGQTYVPVLGQKMQRRRNDARRRLRRLQSSINHEGATPESTRQLLNRLADEFDEVGQDFSEIMDLSGTLEGSVSVSPEIEPSLTFDEPDSVFLEEDLEVVLAENASGQDSISTDHDTPRPLVAVEAEYIVLFAEADDVTASIVKRQLGKNSATVLRAQSCEQALELLTEYPVDLMVINTKINGEDGLDLLRKLRDESAFDNVPIVAVGWPEDVDSEAEVLRYGADEFIAKPFSPNEFSSTIMKLLVASRAAVQKREDRGPVKIARIKLGDRRAEGRDADSADRL
ncbi:MAG: response regulator, partial [Rhodothermales bacterium]|nr:response regulator [Rhodothermales bacterium]